MRELNSYIDHTVLKANTKPAAIEKLCQEAIENRFYAVCVNPCYVSLCKELIGENDVKIASVIGFPLGANTTELKALEAKRAVEDGASEIDMVINVGKMNNGDYEYILNDIKAVVEAAKVPVKVILETCLLTKEEIVKATEISIEAGATFVKTSTGFSIGGATVEDVKLMAETAKGRVLVKASGGVKTREQALQMIAAGADRIGTSSGIAIVTGE